MSVCGGKQTASSISGASVRFLWFWPENIDFPPRNLVTLLWYYRAAEKWVA